MPRLTKAGLLAVITAYVTQAKASGDFEVTRENIAHLIDKIGKQVTLKGSFEDKLPQLDGEELPLGKTIEEFYTDLVSARDYTENVAEMNPLGNFKQTARKPFYSKTLGKKVIPITRPYNDIERACISEAMASQVLDEILMDLYASHSQFKYEMKKGIIRTAMELIDSAYGTNKTYGVNTEYQVADYVKSSGKVGVVMEHIAANGNKTFAERVSAGEIVVLDMKTEIAVPVDTETGEAFIKQVKTDVEAAQFATEGTSLNGALIGAASLVLFVKKGVMPSIEVDTIAGAFNKDSLSLNVDVVVVDDFNGYTNGWALLVDKRALRLHSGWKQTLTQENAAQAWINYFLHTENTAFVSRNCFMKKYVAPAA